MTAYRARDLHRYALAAALVVKGLSWPAAPREVALALLVAGLVATVERVSRVAFGFASALIWVTIATDGYLSNHFYLLGLLTAYATLMRSGDAPRGLGELLTMVQITAVYVWAAVWKLAPPFLSGSVLSYEWGRSWLFGPSDAPPALLALLAAGTVAAELALGALLWSRRFVVPWAIGLAGVLHLGMFLSIGAAPYVTGELVAFALACASSYPFFIARRTELAPSRTPLGRRHRAATTAPSATRATRS